MIRVLTNRTVKSNNLVSAKKQLNELYKAVKINKGFINAKSYIDIEQENILTISDWSSKYEWDNWLDSNERHSTLNNYKYTSQITHKVLYKLKDEIFLL